MKNLIKSLTVLGLILNVSAANAGFLDGLKNIGKGVTEVAVGIVDTAVSTTTNAYQVAKEGASHVISTTNSVVVTTNVNTGVVGRDRGGELSSPAAPDVYGERRPLVGGRSDVRRRVARTDVQLQRQDIRNRQGFSRYQNQRIRTGQADEKVSADYVAFMVEFSEKLSGLRKTCNGFDDGEKHQSCTDYYVTPKGKYDVVEVESYRITRTIKDPAFKSRLLLECCACPVNAEDFVSWTNGIMSVLNDDLVKANALYEHRRKYYTFLSTWEKWQQQYEKLLARFKIRDVSLVFVDCKDSFDAIGEGNDNPASYQFLGRVKTAFACDGKYAFKCPRTADGLKTWMESIRVAYMEKSKPYYAKIKAVETGLKELSAAMAIANDPKVSNATDIIAYSVVDRKGFEVYQKELKGAVSEGRQLPKTVDTYLDDDTLMASLNTVVARVNSINGKAAKISAELRQRAMLTEELVKHWRAGCSTTNVPSVMGIEPGTTLYAAAPKIVSAEIVKEDEGRYRKCVLGSVAQLPALRDVFLEFHATSSTQDMCMVRGWFSFNKDMPYQAVVDKYVRTLSKDAKRTVEKRVVGYEVEELRTRNAWAAWQFDYHTKRGKLLSEEGQSARAEKQMAVRNDLIERYSIQPTIVSTTTLSADGYEVVVNSDPREKNAENVTVTDKILLSKLK